jgi:hypothetical protein
MLVIVIWEPYRITHNAVYSYMGALWVHLPCWVQSDGSTIGYQYQLNVSFTLNRPGKPRGGVEVKLSFFFNLDARWGCRLHEIL